MLQQSEIRLWILTIRQSLATITGNAVFFVLFRMSSNREPIAMKILLGTDSRRRFVLTRIRLNTVFNMATKYWLIIYKENLYLYFKAFLKNLVSSCCVTSFSHLCPANPTFLVLQWPIFILMIITGSQTSQITPSSNKNRLTTSQNFLKNLSLKLLCDVIFSWLVSQPNIPCFAKASSDLHDYQLWTNFSDHTKFKHDTFN